ncbi:MAG TPA: redoxin family protein [Solirubrobacteraceae bacterium]|jgi:peroxiredoxin|nr:redoxin family protein [Solirubrobacteraceae bacterium]
MSLSVGDPFPAVAVQSVEGPVDLAERWAQAPLVVTFHRLWCPFCQQSALQLQAAREAGADVVIVYRQDAQTVAEKCGERGVGECVADPGQALERATGLERFKATRYVAFAPTKLVGALREGGRVGMVNTDLLQGRGTYVVGRDGRVAYAHVSGNASDIPPLDDVLAAVRAAA